MIAAPVANVTTAPLICYAAVDEECKLLLFPHPPGQQIPTVEVTENDKKM